MTRTSCRGREETRRGVGWLYVRSRGRGKGEEEGMRAQGTEATGNLIWRKVGGREGESEDGRRER